MIRRCDSVTPKSWTTLNNPEVIAALASSLNTYEG